MIAFLNRKRITILAFRASSIGTVSTDRPLIAYAITARMVSCCIMIFVGTPSASIAPGTFTQLRAAVLAGIDTGCSGLGYERIPQIDGRLCDLFADLFADCFNLCFNLLFGAFSCGSISRGIIDGFVCRLIRPNLQPLDLSLQSLHLGLHLLHAEFRFTGFCRLRLCGAPSDQKRSNKQQNKYSLHWLHIHTSLPVLNGVVQYNSTPHSAHMSREMGGAH